MHVSGLVFDRLFKTHTKNKETCRIKQTLKLACLLHDMGHAPLSHASESVMPQLSKLQIPDRFLTKSDKRSDRIANHEDYTIKIIADSSFSKTFKDVEEKFGVDKNCVADLIVGHTPNPDYFTVNGINYFPLLHQLVSSELDCDRMDYLLRDSYFCGVSYGNYDLDWIIDNLRIYVKDNIAELAITERAISTFDDFLLSRYHMFLMVYFHYRSVCLEKLLIRYFETSNGEYKIPSDIEEYLHHDDHHLTKVMRNSSNKYAQAIIKNHIPEKIYESFNETQLVTLLKIESFLKEQGIECIRCSSTGRLSKYYSASADLKEYNLKVKRDVSGLADIYFNINEATDLFSKFSESHAVNRLHCNLSELTEEQKAAIIKIQTN